MAQGEVSLIFAGWQAEACEGELRGAAGAGEGKLRGDQRVGAGRQAAAWKRAAATVAWLPARRRAKMSCRVVMSSPPCLHGRLTALSFMAPLVSELKLTSSKRNGNHGR